MENATDAHLLRFPKSTLRLLRVRFSASHHEVLLVSCRQRINIESQHSELIWNQNLQRESASLGFLLKDRFAFLRIACASALVFGTCALAAQTYQIGSDSSKPAQAPASKKQQAEGQQLGWGSNIQNARIARAAQLALQKGDKAQALDYARRAVHSAPNDPQLWFLLGYAARLNARYGESVEAYSHGLKLSPGSVEGTSGLAQDYSAMGRIDDAEKLLKEVVAADPHRHDDAVLLGELYMRQKNYDTALEWLNRAERMKPDARAELLMALSYQQLHQMDKANQYLEMAKHRDPNNPDVERSLAGYYRETGNLPEAIKALQSIRHPKPDVLAELAYTYQLDGKMDDSARVYAQAANAVPKDLALQLSAAQAQIAAGSVAAAEPFLHRSESIDPNYYRLHAIRGEIARMQERNEDAAKEYAAAIEHLPAEPSEGPLYGVQLHMDLMQIDQSLNRTDDAHQQLQIAETQINAVNQQAVSPDAFLRLRALIRLSSGNLDGALSDIRQALALNQHSRDDLQLDGDILMKMGQTEEAIATYKKILDIDPKDRFALTSLGYASRAAGRNDDAEKYFRRLAQVDPKSYVPYLALGDLFTARGDYKDAQASYTKAYSISPKGPLIVAGGMNAAIEAHNLRLAGDWLARAKGSMLDEPQVLREEERYYSFKGDYTKSEQIAQRVIKLLPHDRDVIVYLGYDMLHLEQYDDLLKLTSEYNSVLPKEADIPLLAGYAHKHFGQSELATKDFTEAIERDPKVETAYVNRGYMLNDLHKPDEAAQDFETALKLDPSDGQAHLGLAYANLDLHKPGVALHQADLAEHTMGDIRDVHVIRATAYGREDLYGKAAKEYRAALRFTPNDGALHLGLGNALFAERDYHRAIDELQVAQKYAPENPQIYATMARAYANLDNKPETLRYVNLAEQRAKSAPAPRNQWEEPVQAAIFVDTGEALSTIGDNKAAMQRFTSALDTPGSNRVNVRLAIAQLWSQEGHDEDAERQVALAMMEAETGDTPPPSGPQLVAAADVFRGLHDYRLSDTFLQRAQKAGAPDAEVRVGMANNYLAVGDTTRAKAELAAVNTAEVGGADYQYLLARANVFRQEHHGAQALTSFAEATNAEGEDETAQQDLLATGGEEGWRVNKKLSLLTDLSVAPIFEDSTVYVLDAKTDAAFPVSPNNPSLLPPPRSSLQTQWTDAYHLHLNYLGTASGFFQIRNARGVISVPATNSIVNRDTTDYNFNFGVNPTLRLGTSTLTFNSGIQGTLRRDAVVPQQMNQNLFRMFTFVSSSTFFNALSFSGYIIRESGPFTDINLHSSSLTGALDFRVGSPWGKTALVTGWGMTDTKFSPLTYENYLTSSYIGIDRRFGQRLDVRAMLEDIRSWRVFNSASGIAQNLRPAGELSFTPHRNWLIQASSSYSSTRSFHVYDATQNGFSVAYSVPIRRKFNDGKEPLTLAYPIRFSGGLQEETFFNFPGSHSQQLRPYFGITIF